MTLLIRYHIFMSKRNITRKLLILYLSIDELKEEVDDVILNRNTINVSN